MFIASFRLTLENKRKVFSSKYPFILHLC